MALTTKLTHVTMIQRLNTLLTITRIHLVSGHVFILLIKKPETSSVVSKDAFSLGVVARFCAAMHHSILEPLMLSVVIGGLCDMLMRSVEMYTVNYAEYMRKKQEQKIGSGSQ